VTDSFLPKEEHVRFWPTNLGNLVKWCVSAALVFCCVACGANQPPTQAATALPTLTPVPGVLFVDAARELGPISPYVYGSSYGPWVNVPLDLMGQAEAAGITYLRFPGGEWGDQYDLKDFHIDRFIELARRIGAEPHINVRMPGGSPEAAAELVRYCNVTNDYNVRYWAIGNEPNLYTGFQRYDDYDTVRYNREWREIAEAMLAVDHDILLLGPGTSQYPGNPETDPRDEAGRDWVREFLLSNGDVVDIVAIHRYPFPTSMAGPPRTTDDLRHNSREWDTIIPRLRAVIRETTGRDMPVAITEINSDVSIYAARREDGALTMMIVNLGPEEKHKPLRLTDATATGQAEVWLFDVDHRAEQVSAQVIADGTEIILPPQSISLYIVP